MFHVAVRGYEGTVTHIAAFHTGQDGQAQCIAQVLVVADEKTPAGWAHPNVEFLGMEQQNQLGYEILPLTPLHSYA